jgi:hypothetical protein
VRSSLVPARKPPGRPGRYCIRLSRVFTSAVSWLILTDFLAADSPNRSRRVKGALRASLRDRLTPTPDTTAAHKGLAAVRKTGSRGCPGRS